MSIKILENRAKVNKKYVINTIHQLMSKYVYFISQQKLIDGVKENPF